MPGTQFLDALRAAHATRRAVSRPLQAITADSVADMLGAVLLDHTGLSPTDLLSGSTVLVHDDSDVVAAVLGMLHRIWPHGLTLLRNSAYDESYTRAVSQGTPVIIVLTDRLAFAPVDAVLLADRDLDIGEVGRASVIAALTQAVSGTAVHLSDEDAAQFGFTALLHCCPLHSTGDDCVRRIRAWLDRPVEGVEDGIPQVRDPGQPVTPDPVPVGAVAAGVVRRLSEMTGFGEARTWGMNLATDLREYRAGRLAWSDVDRGVLLSGPPGSGKTTFAKALAMECGDDVQLVPTTYTEWSAAGGYGDSMSKGLTKLFDKWRKMTEDGPIILFVDEIDTIGKRGGNGNNESWFTSVINAWLAFLDGAVPRDGIVVVAATNYPERVDPALLRPGRLDRHIELPMPDVQALVGIVRSHLGSDAVLIEGELAEAARAVRGRSPAEIQLLCREARRVARWCKRRVCAGDLVDVMATRRLGVDAEIERRTAVHEAGHAVAVMVLGVDRMTSVDLDAGRTSMLRASYSTRAMIEGRLVGLLAARAAEELMLGAPTTGAAFDLVDATQAAMELHANWGMGALGLVSLPGKAAIVDREVRDAARATLDEAYGRAKDFVREHRGAIERVADALITRRYLDAAEVKALVAGPVPAPVKRSAPMARRVGPAQAPGCA